MVLVLLAAVLYRPLRLPLGTAVLVVLLLPFLNAHPAAAWHIYGLAFDKIVASSMPPPGRWSDLTGILATLGIGLPLTFLTILRLAAAFATLQVGYLAVVRQRRAVAALDIFALSVCYLMLMSPRTEENTYVMLAVVLALFAIMLRQYDGERFRYRLLVVFCIALGCHSYGRWISEPTVFWLKPLLCLAFLPILIEACLGALFYRGALSVEAEAGSSET